METVSIDTSPRKQSKISSDALIVAPSDVEVEEDRLSEESPIELRLVYSDEDEEADSISMHNIVHLSFNPFFNALRRLLFQHHLAKTAFTAPT